MPRLLTLAGLAILVLQVSASQRPGTASVEGFVVRWGTGEPLPGVDVELARVEGSAAYPLGPLTYPPGEMGPGLVLRPTYPNPADLLHTRTGSDGRFSFRNLLPGTYRLLAARAGGMYHPAEYGQHHPRGKGYNFPLMEGQEMRDLKLEMAANGSISGRILNEDGTPAVRVQVMLFESSYQSGRPLLGLKQSALTDDRGEYRLFFLPPGRYFIGARLEDPRRRTISFRRYGQDAGTETQAEAAVVVSRSQAGELVEETFVTVYYGGNTDPGSAKAILVAPGAAINGMDILLTGGQPRAFRVRGTIVDGNGMPAPRVIVRAIPAMWTPSQAAPGIASDPAGNFEIVGLPPGAYSIRGSQTVGGVPLTAMSRVEINSANVDGVRLVLTAGSSTSGTIILEGRTASGQPLDISTFRVNLVPDNPAFSAGLGSPLTGNSFTVAGIQPGDYRVGVNPVARLIGGPPYSPAPEIAAAFQSMFVKSIRMGGEDVLERGIRLQGQPPREIEVVLGVNGGTLQGTIVDARRQPIPNSVVVIVPPAILRARRDLYKSATSDANGRFRLVGLAPGDYQLFAWKYLEEGRWYDPQFLASVETRGKALRIGEGSLETIELPVLPEEP